MVRSLCSFLNLFTSETSIHGIRHINDPKTHRIIRIFWFIIFILSIVGLAYYVRGVYIKWKISPDISISEHLMSIREIPFPALTVCSPVSVKNEFANYQDALNHIIRKNHTPFQNLSFEKQQILAALVQSCDPILSNTFDDFLENSTGSEVVNYLIKSSFTTNEALFLCLLIDDTNKNCSEIMNQIFTMYGICYSYNMQGYYTIFNRNELSKDFDLYKRNGVRNVFDYYSQEFNDEREVIQWTMEKGYLSNDEKLFPYRADNKNSIEFVFKIPKIENQNLCPSLRDSYKVIFHAPNEIPTKFHEYIYVNLGSQFLISMQAKLFTHGQSLRKFSAGVRQCYFDGERKLKFFKSYTKAHCDLECLTNYTLRECGCVHFSMPRTNETPVCDLVNYACYDSASRDWPHSDETLVNLLIPCDCYPPCNSIKYKTKFFDNFEGEDLINRFERKKASNDSVILTKIKLVFKDYLITHQVNFVNYRLQNFIAEFGGLLGLFMGGSLLSIVELVYLCIKGVIDDVRNRMQKRKTVKLVLGINNNLN